MEDDTVFSDDPVATATHWVNEGARRLHLVDLNGAFEGKPVNAAAVEAILDAVRAEVVIHVVTDAATLAGAPGVGFLDEHGIISDEHVRDLAARPDATLTPVTPARTQPTYAAGSNNDDKEQTRPRRQLRATEEDEDMKRLAVTWHVTANADWRIAGKAVLRSHQDAPARCARV